MIKWDLHPSAFHIQNCERFPDQVENTVRNECFEVFLSSPYLRSPETVTSTYSPILKWVRSYVTAIFGIIPHVNT